jgi:dihydrofolate reductase
MTAPARIVIVVALARNRVIGRDNGLPWHISSDLKHFKATTMGRPMIMGRKTFLSIGKPLPGRTSIVVTRDPTFAFDGIEVAPNLTEAIARGRQIAARDGVDEVMVTGGGEIYAQALPLADHVIATELDLAADGTVHFPALNPSEWRETARTAHPQGPRDDASYTIVTYDRIRPAG